MQNLKKFGKKLFTMSVVSMTVAWSVGLSAFVPAGAALAAPMCPELSAGDLFKVTGNSAVYLVNSSNKRMYFPNAEVYNTWYKDFSGITTIDTSCVEAFPSGGGVNFRPGSRLVKTPVSPSVYAVGPNNMKMKIADEATASALYGSNWSTLVRTLNDVFDSNYNVGAPLSGATLHNGQLVKKSGESTVYYVWDGALKMVDGTLPSNVAGDVRTVSAAVFSSVAMSTGSVTASTVVNNPAQQSGSVVPPVTNPTGGSVTVGLSAETPAAGTLAGTTVYNNMLKVTLNATGADVKLKGVTVTRTGLIANSSVAGISVWDAAGNRHGDVLSSFSSDNKVTIGFGTYPIVVTKGVPTTFTVAFNIADVSSGTVGATITSAADLQTDGTVVGTFPVVGNTMSVVSGSTLANMTVIGVSPGGIDSSDSAITSATGNVEIGETKEIAKYKFTQANGNSDVVVSKMTFYVAGTAKDKDLKNFEVLAPDNTVLGHTELMSDRYVTVNFDKPYTVPKSVNRTLTLRATIADGSGNWFRIQVQNDYDLMVKDTSTGYYVLPTDGDSTWTATTLTTSDAYFKMKSGTLTISKTSDSPSTTISAGASDVVLARFNVKAVGEDLEIRKIGLKIATGTTALGLTGSVKLRVGTDVLYTASVSETSGTIYTSASTQYTLSQYLNLKSGETKVLEVVGSIPTTATSASSYLVSVGNMYAKRLSTLDYADTLPGTTANNSANTVTVESATVTLAKDTAMGNMTRASASTQVIGQYTIKAGSAENIKLSNVTVKFNSYGAWNTPSHLQNLELWVGDTQYGSTVSSVATSSNVFLGSLLINKNEIKTIKVKAYIVSGADGTVSSTIDAYNYVGVDTQNTTSETTDVTGQDNTIGSANVIISAANDNSTTPSILVPSGTATAQIGKWKVEAQNEAVTLKKMTFSVFTTGSTPDTTGAVDTANSNFGTFYLYDEANMATALGSASYIGGSGNGYVQFTGLNFTIAADTYKYLVVKANVTDSGVMTPNTVSALAITNDASTNLEIVSSSGTTLGKSAIDGATVNASYTGTESIFGTSTFHLFHNAVPKITPVCTAFLGDGKTCDQTLVQGSNSQILKFTVTNPGTRELRISSTTIRLSASGLTGNGTTATGSVETFSLYEANSSGGLGTQLATTNTCALTGNSGSLSNFSGYSCQTLGAAGAALLVTFNTDDDVASALGNLTVSAGGSRTFVFTADTSRVFNGKTTGSVSLSPALDGDSGFAEGAAGWAGGVMQYYYTPVGASEQGPFTASDSYDVNGSTLTLSL